MKKKNNKMNLGVKYQDIIIDTEEEAERLINALEEASLKAIEEMLYSKNVEPTYTVNHLQPNTEEFKDIMKKLSEIPPFVVRMELLQETLDTILKHTINCNDWSQVDKTRINMFGVKFLGLKTDKDLKYGQIRKIYNNKTEEITTIIVKDEFGMEYILTGGMFDV